MDHADLLEIVPGVEVSIPRAGRFQVCRQPALINRLESVTQERGAEPVTLRRRIDPGQRQVPVIERRMDSTHLLEEAIEISSD